MCVASHCCSASLFVMLSSCVWHLDGEIFYFIALSTGSQYTAHARELLRFATEWPDKLVFAFRSILNLNVEHNSLSHLNTVLFPFSWNLNCFSMLAIWRHYIPFQSLSPAYMNNRKILWNNCFETTNWALNIRSVWYEQVILLATVSIVVSWRRLTECALREIQRWGGGEVSSTCTMYIGIYNVKNVDCFSATFRLHVADTLAKT